MRLFNTVIMIFYNLFFVIIGLVLIAVGLHLKNIIELSVFLENIYSFPNLWVISIIVGALIILLSMAITRITFSNFQREKTIAFATPAGQVTISLMAVEDFIRRLAEHISEVKDIRPDVVAGKKGIDIFARITLWADASIPDITEKIQTMIKSRVQQMLGIEEEITVRVHIVKILQRGDTKKRKKEESVPTPFRGIEYVER